MGEIMVKQFCVYMMASGFNGTLYVGVTADLHRRIYEHKEGLVEGFTKQYGIKYLVWYEMHDTAESAIQREKQIKEWKRAWKINRIKEKNPEWKDLYCELGMDPGLRRNDELDRRKFK